MDLKAIILDVDGTLAETEELHRRAFDDAFSAHGLPWRWDRATYRRLLATTGGKERLRRFAEECDPAGRAELLAQVDRIHAFKNARYRVLVEAGEARLRPGIGCLVEAARTRGIALAIATTTSPTNVDVLLGTALGPQWRDLFAAVAAGDEVAAKKPAPDVYLLALARLGLYGRDCVAVEDSRNGVLAALGAGVPVVVTPSLYTEGEDFGGAVAVMGNWAAGLDADILELDALIAATASHRSGTHR